MLGGGGSNGEAIRGDLMLAKGKDRLYMMAIHDIITEQMYIHWPRNKLWWSDLIFGFASLRFFLLFLSNINFNYL